MVMRDSQSPEVVDATFNNIPAPGMQIAPGEGLFLDEVRNSNSMRFVDCSPFARTDSKPEMTQCLWDWHNSTITPPNDPISVTSVRPLIDEFIKNRIIPSIVRQEVDNKVYVAPKSSAAVFLIFRI